MNYFDLLEKNAMSALSFSSVQYLSGVRLNDDTSIFVVAIWSFVTRLPGHMTQNLDCNLTITRLFLNIYPRCPVGVAVDRCCPHVNTEAQFHF